MYCAMQAKKSQTVETNLKSITLAKFDLDFEVNLLSTLQTGHTFVVFVLVVMLMIPALHYITRSAHSHCFKNCAVLCIYF